MLPILLSAFLLGLLHSLEPDHIVAVSTIVAKCKNLTHSILTGVFWGFGHAFTITLTAAAIFYAKIIVSETIFVSFEFLVGVMLVYLGYRLIKNTLSKKENLVHNHTHSHDTLSAGEKEKPMTSLFVGSLHGLAGSGAIIALLLSGFSSLNQSLASVLSFALGNIVSMACVSLLLGLSLHYYRLGRFGYLEKYLRVIVGSSAIILGIYKMIKIVV